MRTSRVAETPHSSLAIAKHSSAKGRTLCKLRVQVLVVGILCNTLAIYKLLTVGDLAVPNRTEGSNPSPSAT
jgi:hypothetical protein